MQTLLYYVDWRTQPPQGLEWPIPFPNGYLAGAVTIDYGVSTTDARPCLAIGTSGNNPGRICGIGW